MIVNAVPIRTESRRQIYRTLRFGITLTVSIVLSVVPAISIGAVTIKICTIDQRLTSRAGFYQGNTINHDVIEIVRFICDVCLQTQKFLTTVCFETDVIWLPILMIDKNRLPE